MKNILLMFVLVFLFASVWSNVYWKSFMDSVNYISNGSIKKSIKDNISSIDYSSPCLEDYISEENLIRILEADWANSLNSIITQITYIEWINSSVTDYIGKSDIWVILDEWDSELLSKLYANIMYYTQYYWSIENFLSINDIEEIKNQNWYSLLNKLVYDAYYIRQKWYSVYEIVDYDIKQWIVSEWWFYLFEQFLAKVVAWINYKNNIELFLYSDFANSIINSTWYEELYKYFDIYIKHIESKNNYHVIEMMNYIMDNVDYEYGFVSRKFDYLLHVYNYWDNSQYWQKEQYIWIYTDINETVKSISDWYDNSDKIKIIYSWITSNISYSKDVYNWLKSWYNYWNKRYLYSDIWVFKNREWVCSWYSLLMETMLRFAWISDVEIIDGFVLGWVNNYRSEHAWLRIWELYYDVTWDEWKTENEWKWFWLPYDIMFATRVISWDDRVNNSNLKNLYNENLKTISDNYEYWKYNLLIPFQNWNWEWKKKLETEDNNKKDEINNIDEPSDKTIIKNDEKNNKDEKKLNKDSKNSIKDSNSKSNNIWLSDPIYKMLDDFIENVKDKWIEQEVKIWINNFNKKNPNNRYVMYLMYIYNWL